MAGVKAVADRVFGGTMRLTLALALALLTPASALAALPTPGVHAFEDGSEESDHSFELEAPALVRFDVAPTGFDAMLLLGKDAETWLEVHDAQAFEDAHIATVLPAGEYLLRIGRQRSWGTAPRYELAVSALRADVGAEPLWTRTRSLDEESTEVPTPNEVEIRGVKIETPVPAGAVRAELLGDGQASLVALDGENAVVGGLPDSGTVRRSVDLVGGAARTLVAIGGGSTSSKERVRVLAASSWNEPRQATLTIDADSPRSMRSAVGSEHPLDVPAGTTVVVAAAAPEVYLELFVLDASGAVIGQASEREEEEPPSVEIAPGGKRPAKAVVISADGLPGTYDLTVTAKVSTPLGTGEAYPMGLEGNSLHASGRVFHVPVRTAGPLRVTLPASEGQLVAAERDGRWIALAETEEPELVAGSMASITSRDDADLTAFGMPELPEGLVAGSRVKILEASPMAALVEWNGEQAVVSLDGIAADAVAALQVLELERGEGEDVFLIVRGEGTPSIMRSDRLLETEGSFDVERRVRLADPRRRSAETKLFLAATELVDVTASSEDLGALELTLIGPDGSEVASSSGEGEVKLLALAQGGGDHRVRAGSAAPDGEGTVSLTWRTATGHASEHDVTLADARAIQVGVPYSRLTRRARLEAPPGSDVLVRFSHDSETSYNWVTVRDGAGETLAVDQLGVHVADLVVRVPADGVLDVEVNSDEAAEEAVLSLHALELGAALPVAAARTASGSTRAPAPALDFEFKDASGRSMKLSDLAGKVVILDFWATWCGPCRSTLPRLEALHREHAGDGIVVLGLSSEEAELVAAYRQRTGLTFHTIIDAESRISQAFEVSGIPRTIIIGRDGKVVADIEGAQEDDLVERIALDAVEVRTERAGG